MAEQPTFEYLDMIQRHRRGGHGGTVIAGGATSRPEPPPSRVPSALPKLAGVSGLCWSGLCPGCGKVLISAVHRPVIESGPRADAFYCTRACRAKHTGTRAV